MAKRKQPEPEKPVVDEPILAELEPEQEGKKSKTCTGYRVTLATLEKTLNCQNTVRKDGIVDFLRIYIENGTGIDLLPFNSVIYRVQANTHTGEVSIWNSGNSSERPNYILVNCLMS